MCGGVGLGEGDVKSKEALDYESDGSLNDGDGGLDPTCTCKSHLL